MARFDATLWCALLVLGCTGDPVGELGSDAGTGGSAGAAGNGGAAGGGGAAGSGGVAGGGGLACDGGAPTCVAVIAAATGASSYGLDLDATDVYFASGHDIWRVSKLGGTPASVASGLVGPQHVALGATQIAFTDGKRRLYSVPKSGGTPTLLVEGAVGSYELGGIATDGTWIYYSETLDTVSYDGSVSRVPIGGGTPQVLAPLTASQPRGIALDGGFVYVATEIGQSVLKIPAGGGAPVPVATGLDKPVDVAVSGNWVVWAENSGVGSIPLSGGSETLAPTSSPAHIAADAQNAFVTLPAASSLRRVPLGGTGSLELAASAGTPGDVAVDDVAVYFTNFAGGAPGSVLAVPK